jgi:hypothetical protein
VAVIVTLLVEQERGVYVTEQLLADGLMLTVVQGLPVNVPKPLVVKRTVPTGVEGNPGAVSVTTAVQAVAWPTETVDGLHETVVVVVRGEDAFASPKTVNTVGTELLWIKKIPASKMHSANSANRRFVFLFILLVFPITFRYLSHRAPPRRSARKSLKDSGSTSSQREKTI